MYNITDGLDGHGLGIVKTKVSMDREERRMLLIPLLVSDSGSPVASATVTLTLSVIDVNDNPMKPAKKTVHVNTIQVKFLLLYILF